jgi:hypothetical protein
MYILYIIFHNNHSEGNVSVKVAVLVISVHPSSDLNEIVENNLTIGFYYFLLWGGGGQTESFCFM